MKTKYLKEEKGIVLVLAMLMLLVLTLIGISALNTGTHDILISGNERASVQAFYAAEAGINEFMGRFRDGATNPITDSDQSNPNWKLLLAKNPGKGATKIGYGSGSQNSPSLQNQLDFGVEIKHKVDGGGVVSVNNFPVYIVKSYGFTTDGGNKVIEVEIRKKPNLDPPAALYAENPVNIKGSSTYLQGNDLCGGANNKPGIVTTLPSSDPNAVDVSGGPTISGTPNIQYSGQNLDLQGAINYLKNDANFKYNYTDNVTLAGNHWGTPTYVNTTTPLAYTGNMNIVYFNMQGNKTIKLSGGTTGAGILIVDGNLELNGGFTWYGIVIVRGALDYTGGGEKNITGGIVAGETATIEIDVAGNAGILYCSGAGDWVNNSVSPLKISRWREVF